jgi:riboflavin kinase/FMN adenylyltransferase
MRHYRSLSQLQLKDTWLTIGSFDGVHLGHQALARHIISQAQASSAPSVVLTFHPHPASVVRNRKGRYYLTTPEERANLLGDLGVDYVVTQLFDKHVARTPAFDFLDFLYKHLQMRGLCVGDDFALGRDREGDIPALKAYGSKIGYRVDILPPVEIPKGVVSSSMVRGALREGDVEFAQKLLNRPYAIKGIVIPGDGRGRTLGIPTANLEIWEQKVLPKVGVYMCTASIGGNEFGAVTNIGVRPTFDKDSLEPRVETHLLDFNEDLYARELKLNFISRLREEKKFPDAETLIDQIMMDIERGKEMLKSRTELMVQVKER